MAKTKTKQVRADISAIKKACRIVQNTAGINSAAYGSYCVHKGLNRGSEIVRTAGNNDYIQLAIRPLVRKSDNRRLLQLAAAGNGVITYLETVVNCAEETSPRDFYALLPADYRLTELFEESNYFSCVNNQLSLNGQTIAEYNADMAAQLIADNSIYLEDKRNIHDDRIGSLCLLNDTCTAQLRDNNSAENIGIISAAELRELFGGKAYRDDKQLRLFIYPDGCGIYSDSIQNFISSCSLEFNLDYNGQDTDKVFSLNRRQLSQGLSSFKGVSINFEVFNFNSVLKLDFTAKNIFFSVIFTEDLSGKNESLEDIENEF